METEHILELLLFLCFSLLGGGLLKHALKKTGIPYTVGLFIVGIGFGLLVRFNLLDTVPIIEHSFEKMGHITPDMILYFFLPILVFDAAYNMDVHLFRKTLLNASLLAVPGLIFCTFVTGFALLGLQSFFPSLGDWNIYYALMFGALISATDPVAVVAVLHELHTSKRFSTLVDAESLLNDGTGLVLFMTFYGMATGTGSSLSPYLNFIVVVFGGVALGLSVASISLHTFTRIKSSVEVQNSVIIITSYLVFLLAEEYLHVSGVIALVCYGLYISYYSKLKLKPEVNKFMSQFWNLAAYIGNTLIFIIVGLTIAIQVSFSYSNFIILLILFAVIVIVRLLMVTGLFPIMHRNGYKLSIREGVILSWGGLRGAVGLAMGLMVYYSPLLPLSIRTQVLFFTSGVVALTLLINATTTGWLLKKLGLSKERKTRRFLRKSARNVYINETEKYYKKLREKKHIQECDWTEVEKLLPKPYNFEDEDLNMESLLQALRIRVVRHEKLFLYDLYNDGIINAHSLARLQSLADRVFDVDGKRTLSNQDRIFKRMLMRGTRFLGFKAPKWYRKFLDKFFPARTVQRHDISRGFVLMQKEAIKQIEEYSDSDFFKLPMQQEQIEILKKEIYHNIEFAENYMARLKRRHPESYNRAITIQAERMLSLKKKQIKERLQKEGVV